MGTGTGGGGGYGGGGSGGGNPPATSTYTMTQLVSNGSVSAHSTDAKLVNPWGIAFAPGAPVWVANNGSQTSTLYDGAGAPQSLVVAIPPGLNGPANPTGVVFNGDGGFTVSKGTASATATFIFDGEGGTLTGWAQSVDAQNAIVMYDDGAGGAVYKGLALARDGGGAAHLYAADFHNNKVDVFDSSWSKVAVAGGFKDSTLPAGYAPFGIQALTVQNQTLIYVAYAQQQAPQNHDNTIGAGLGLVDVFDTAGNLKSHLIDAGGKLNAPWGMALAPAKFGSLSNALLVGNLGDGWINAFNPQTGAFMGTVQDSGKQPIAIDGLWGIAFGNDALNQPSTTLFFAAGIAHGVDGLYGRIDLGTP
ncbi:MAG: TIGR03118 family protein [Proteobacteria bacterium]|nr:TIGR03118 family protein [Pseudomonadota bacterium]